MGSKLHIIKRKIGKPLRRMVGNVLKLFEKNSYIVMYIDGGFSSQMLRYTKGMYFKELGHKVKYDLSWYDYDGMDDLKNEKREWRLAECFPKLEIEAAKPKEITKYRRFYGTDIHDTENRYRGKESEIHPPLYVARYDFDYLVNFQMTKKYFDWSGIHHVLGKCALELENKIIQYKKEGKKLIGVHVRRGDMTVTGDYWKVLTGKYFEVAINKVVTNNSVLLFFSNGFDFVKKEILPFVQADYILVENNNKDYEDIYLYSLCHIQIASQGSWGEMAFVFNTNKDRKLVLPVSALENAPYNSEIVPIELKADMYLED